MAALDTKFQVEQLENLSFCRQPVRAVMKIHKSDTIGHQLWHMNIGLIVLISTPKINHCIIIRGLDLLEIQSDPLLINQSKI